MADDIFDPTDPRQKLRKYLLDQQQRRARMDDPAYRESVNQDIMGGYDSGARGALAAGIMSGAAQMGTLNGKAANADSVGDMADRLAKTRAGFDNKMAAEDDNREKRYGMDTKVYEYLADKKRQQEQDAATSKYRSDTLAATNQRHKDTIAAAATNKANARNEKDENDTNKEFERLNDHIRGSVRDSIGDEKKKLRNATHALQIIGGEIDLNHLNSIQVKEIAGALAAQVSQGSPAMRTLEEMTPSTAAGDLAKVYSYISGKPAPAEQGDFVKMFREMVERQRDTSREIIAGELGPVVSTYGHLRKKDKKKFDQIMASAGVSLDDDNNLMAYEPKYAPPAGKHDEPGEGGAGTALAGPKKTYKVGDEKVIGGVVNVKGADGLWNPKK